MQFIDLNAQYYALKERVDANIARVLEHAHYIGGEEVKTLSEELARYCGVQRGNGCAGRRAVHLRRRGRADV